MEQAHRSYDVHHAFFAAFLGVWAAFLLRAMSYSPPFAFWVIAIAAFLVQALHRSFTAERTRIWSRVIDFHLWSMAIAALGGLAIFDLGTYYLPTSLSRPTRAEAFLVVTIVFFWILSIELVRLPRELRAAREHASWMAH